tara:strand:+ start:148 stop:798 length:651 start_codon:yes stop_codon:yes gene_type:complete
MIINRFKYIRKIKYFLKNYKRSFYVFNDLNDKSIFIDIGGNLGRVSQYVYDVFNPKIIEIYEPHNSLYSNLKTKFKGIENILIFNEAVSNVEAEGSLYLKTDSSSDLNLLEGSSLEVGKKNIDKNIFQKTHLISIQSIIDKYDYIDCIKIDIEGHEYKILEILFKNKSKIGKVVCEFHGTDEDINNNKNIEFRKDFELFRDKINYHKNINWLIEWD